MAAENTTPPPSAGDADSGLTAGDAYTRARPEERGPILKSMIEGAVNRLAVIVDEETEALRQGAEADFKTFNARKSFGFIELSRALRLLGEGKPDPATARMLQDLSAKLEVNRQMLKLHLDAVGEVASIISQSIQEAESDGTYTVAFRSKGQKP